MADVVELKVAEALQNDVGKGIVRIDSRARKTLNSSSGDIVEIKGRKSTAGIVSPLYPEEEGLNIIRMDGYLRNNAGVAIGDKVTLKPADLKEAKKVVLAPTVPLSGKGFAPGFDEYLKRRLLGRAITKGDTIIIRLGVNFQLPLIAAVVQPQGIAIIRESSEIVVKTEPVKEMGKIPSISYEDIGGIKDEVQKIREMVELPMRHPELFERLGIEPPKGVLIHGPPGCGKTLLAKAVASESEANFINIAGPELVSKFVGESEERLRQVFKDAEENAPSIIFMDEIDAIAPKREEVQGEVERRMVSQLLTLMDGLNTRGNVIVIGATNRPNAIDPALRRPGRFDRELEIGVPDRNGRKEILEIHTRGMPIDAPFDVSIAKSVMEKSGIPRETIAAVSHFKSMADIEKSPADKIPENVKSEIGRRLYERFVSRLADVTHGYTGADISSLTKEAAMKTLRRVLPQIDLEQEFIPQSVLESLRVVEEDFQNALREIQPSALREVFVEIPNVRWEDVGGLENTKKELDEAVQLPLKRPEVFTKMGIRPVKGILLVGIPGTGKTMLAKAVANESEANFISVKGPEVLSKWVGESEKAIREIFRKARMAAPCVIFIDEIDAIASRRGGGDEGTKAVERVVNSMLTEMDGMQNLKNVVVIAESNRPDIIDPALLRPGRFDKIITLPAPDEITRLEIFKVHTKAMPLASDVKLPILAKLTEGYTGADIEGVCREAGMYAIRAEKETVDMAHFQEALKTMKSTVTKEQVDRMESFKKGQDSMFR